MAIDSYVNWERIPRSIDGWERVFKNHDKLSKLNVKCKNCGHTVFPARDRIICSYCGNWVYKNDKIEFKYKFKEILKRS